MLVLFVRHGETHANLLPGSAESLTPRGKRQVDLLARRLKEYHPQAIYSSTLDRAQVTAAEIRLYHPRARFTVTADLNEISSAHIRMTPRIENGKKVIPPRAKFLAQRKQAERMFRAINTWKHNTVIVVSHGNLITYLLAKFMEVPCKKGSFFRIDNASVTAVEVGPEGARLLLLNGRKHLPPRTIPSNDPHLQYQ